MKNKKSMSRPGSRPSAPARGKGSSRGGPAKPPVFDGKQRGGGPKPKGVTATLDQKIAAAAKSPGAFIEIPKSHRVVMGNHAIFEAIATAPEACEQLFFKLGWESHQDLKEIHKRLRGRSVKMQVLADSALDRFGSHQGAILTVSSRPTIQWDKLAALENSSILVLDGIEDPHNLGAIIRTSWLMGTSGILIPQDRAVGVTATVHKVACGGCEHVAVEEVVQFAPSVEELKKSGYWVFGLSHKSKRTIFDLKIPEKVVWCIGAEDKGLRSTTERLCDELVSIPQTDAAASYNASVATAIALSETSRQMRTRTLEKSSS